MKLINIIFTVLVLLSACHKKDAPAPASSMNGTYIGSYDYSDGKNPDVINSNMKATITNGNTFTINGESFNFTYYGSGNNYQFTHQATSYSSLYLVNGSFDLLNGDLKYSYQQKRGDPNSPDMETFTYGELKKQ